MPADEDLIEDLPSLSDVSSDHEFYRALLAKAHTLPEGEERLKHVLIEYASELLARLNLSAATNASKGKALEEAIQDLTYYVSNQRVYLFIKLCCPVLLHASHTWPCSWWLCEWSLSASQEDCPSNVLFWVNTRGQKPRWSFTPGSRCSCFCEDVDSVSVASCNLTFIPSLNLGYSSQSYYAAQHVGWLAISWDLAMEHYLINRSQLSQEEQEAAKSLAKNLVRKFVEKNSILSEAAISTIIWYHLSTYYWINILFIIFLQQCHPLRWIFKKRAWTCNDWVSQ